METSLEMPHRTKPRHYLGQCTRAAVSTACCLLLFACATYRAQPIVPAELMHSFEARSLDDPALQRYVNSHSHREADSIGKNSWDLKTLTLAAFYFSPELDLARTQSATSQAAIRTASQRPNPSLQFPLEYASNAKAGESPYTYGLGLDIPIETAGKRGYRVAQAGQLSNAARFNVGNVAWQIRSRLRLQMLNLYAAMQRTSIVEQQITAQQQVVEMLDKRLALGAASSPEANLAQIALSQDRLDLANGQKQVLDIRAQMATVIGLPVSALNSTRVQFDEFEHSYTDLPGDAVRQHAVLNRADVLAALSEYEAIQAALQLEIARQYPDIHVGPGYTFDAGTHKFVFPISGIALPLFNRNAGPIAEATARRKEGAARVNALQIQAINDADRAVQNYRLALANLRLADSLLSAQGQRYQALQTSFHAGETDRLTLTLAQHEYYANDLARNAARVQLQQAVGQLEDAMQRPLSATDLPIVPELEESPR